MPCLVLPWWGSLKSQYIPIEFKWEKRPTERGGGFYVQRTVFDVLRIRYSKRRTAAMQPQPAAAQVKRTHINQVVLELEQH